MFRDIRVLGEGKQLTYKNQQEKYNEEKTKKFQTNVKQRGMKIVDQKL